MPEWMNLPWAQNLWESVFPHLPTVAVALGILVGGWLLALIVRYSVFAALKRTTLDDRIAEYLGFEKGADDQHRIERTISTIVYYLVLTFVVVALFGYLKIDAVTEPLLTLLNEVAQAVPQLGKAFLIAIVGILAAAGLRRLAVGIVERTGIEARMKRLAGEPDAEEPGNAAQQIGSVVYWFVIVVVAIPVLEALKIGALSGPLSRALEAATTYLPQLGAAMLLLLAGYVVGRIVRSLVGSALSRIGLDTIVERFAGKLTGEVKVSGILGTAAMVVVVFHFATSAVGRLNIPEISGPLAQILEQAYAYLPRLFVGLVVLAVGALAARAAAYFATKLLAGLGFNRLVASVGLSKEGETAEVVGDDSTSAPGRLFHLSAAQVRTPAGTTGLVLGAILFLLFARQALDSLQMPGIAQLMDGLLAYLPQVLAAVLVIGAGLWAGRWVRSRIEPLTASHQDRLVRYTAPVAHSAIVVVSVMAALQQLGVAKQLVAIAFTLVLGAVCLAAALAFGLGGRDTAAKLLEKELGEGKPQEKGAGNQ